MTDKECLMQLINKLKLKETKYYPDSKEYIITNNTIKLGSSCGNNIAEFEFDSEGNIVNYSLNHLL